MLNSMLIGLVLGGIVVAWEWRSLQRLERLTDDELARKQAAAVSRAGGRLIRSFLVPVLVLAVFVVALPKVAPGLDLVWLYFGCLPAVFWISFVGSRRRREIHRRGIDGQARRVEAPGAPSVPNAGKLTLERPSAWVLAGPIIFLVAGCATATAQAAVFAPERLDRALILAGIWLANGGIGLALLAWFLCHVSKTPIDLRSSDPARFAEGAERLKRLQRRMLLIGAWIIALVLVLVLNGIIAGWPAGLMKAAGVPFMVWGVVSLVLVARQTVQLEQSRWQTA